MAVVLEDVPVMYVEAVGGPAGAALSFEALESRLMSLLGRRFYGVVHHGQYRACVAMRDSDDASALGLETGVIPGGRYERQWVKDWPERIGDIAAIFEAMASQHAADTARPHIEFYRSEKNMILYLPVR